MEKYPLIQGIVIGLAIAVMIGPAFFALLQTSINRGFRKASQLAIGIVLSDFTLILASYLGLSNLLTKSAENQMGVGLVGGIILIIFGVYNYLKAPVPKKGKNQDKPIAESNPGFFTFFFKGYFMNILNPFLMIWWMTMMMSVTSTFKGDSTSIYICFGGVLGTVFGTDLLKAYAARSLKKFLNDRVLLYINRGLGILLIAFGVIMIFRVFFETAYFWK